MKYSIYIITNTITRKQYIGYSNDPHSRFNRHKWHGKRGTGPCKRLYQSMHKHGIDNFSFDILIENIDDIDTAKRLEIKYIEEYCTFTKGYNSTKGGTGGDMNDHESWKISMKKYHENKVNDSYATYGMKDKTHSDESKLKQAEKRTEYWNSLTMEQRIERSETIKGKNNGMFGKVPKNAIRIKFNDKVYNSLSEAVKDTGHSAQFIKKYGNIL